MSDNPKDNIPSRDRVSIRAVLVEDGEDPSVALAEAGIYDPVAIPVVFGETLDLSGGILGDGVTANLTAVLETEQQDEPEDASDPQSAEPRRQPAETGQPVTSPSPAAYGQQSLAPVSKAGQA